MHLTWLKPPENKVGSDAPINAVADSLSDPVRDGIVHGLVLVRRDSFTVSKIAAKTIGLIISYKIQNIS